jgi:hypothetical protein
MLFKTREMLNVRLLSVSRPSLSSVASHFPPNFGSAKKHSAKCLFPPHFLPPHFLLPQQRYLLHFPPRFSGRFPAAGPASGASFSIFRRRPSSTKLPHFGQKFAPIFRPISPQIFRPISSKFMRVGLGRKRGVDRGFGREMRQKKIVPSTSRFSWFEF